MEIKLTNENCRRLHYLLAWEQNCIRFHYDTATGDFVGTRGESATIGFGGWKNEEADNGIYIMFEKGEIVNHEGGKKTRERIVRVGINRENGNLIKRIKKHYTGTMRTSVLRKYVGSCFLNKDNPEYRPEYETNKKLLEQRISEYIQNDITFALIILPNKTQREELESKLISTIAHCGECQPSANWLGKYCSEPKIANGKLWNKQGLNAEPVSNEDLDTILSKKLDSLTYIQCKYETLL